MPLLPVSKDLETSYIKDTNHFLHKISELGEIPNDAFLCTIDVVGLYPSIPHEEGLEALEGVYYSVAIRRIRPHFGCGIRFSQDNQCGIRFLYCYAVAENWNLNERFTVFAYFV